MEKLSKSLRAYVRSLHEQSERLKENALLVEGRNAVEQAFAAKLNCRFIVIGPNDKTELPSTTTIYHADEKDMDFLSSTKTSYGIAGIFEIPARTQMTGDCLLCDGIQDPGNLGMLIRSAAAFGFGSVVCTGRSADPYSPKTIRSSAGYIFSMTVIKAGYEDLPALFDPSYMIYGTELTQSALPLWTVVPKQPFCIMIGSEGNGISAQAAGIITQNVIIPMTDATESLNAAAAGSIIMSYFYGRLCAD